MKAVLSPIYDREQYSQAVEPLVIGYFKETVFDPLLGLLRGADLLRENELADWGWFPRSWGSLGIPRAEMPQLRGEQREDFLLSLTGCRVVTRVVPTKKLQPTQDQFSPTKVQKARDYQGKTRAIIVSADLHILDGHHQWAAEMADAPDGTTLVDWVGLPIRELLDAARQFNQRGNTIDRKEHPAIWDALLAGVIWYAAGVFIGRFDAAISRELRAIGARKVPTGFALSLAAVPIVLRGALQLTAARSTVLHSAVQAFLDQAEVNLPTAPLRLGLKKTVDNITQDLQKQFQQTVSEVEELPPATPVPEGLIERLREKLDEGIGRQIKGFSLESIQQLRAKVRKNFEEGGRPDRLAQVIEAEYGVTKRKARIIAESETSFFVSNFRRARYEALGSTEYLWDTSHDEKVRPTHGESNNHRILDGRRFAWASPPVVDSATGRRRHPGEDYGPCRCVARPILNFS